MKKIATVVFLIAATTQCHAQGQLAEYQAAERAYESALASCKNPVGIACLQQRISYTSCQIRLLGPNTPGSCGTPPSCAISCTIGGSGGGVGGLGTVGTGSSGQQLANLAAQGIGAIALHFMNENDAAPAGPTPEEIAAQKAAAEAARRQKIQSDATDILNAANAATAASAPPDPPPAPDVATQLNSILGGPTPNVAAAFDSLLGDGVTRRTLGPCIMEEDHPAGMVGASAYHPGMNAPNAFSRYYNTCSYPLYMVNTLPNFSSGPSYVAPGAFIVMEWKDGVKRDVHVYDCAAPKKPVVRSGGIYVNPPFGTESIECIDATVLLLAP